MAQKMRRLEDLSWKKSFWEYYVIITYFYRSCYNDVIFSFHLKMGKTMHILNMMEKYMFSLKF